MKHIRYIMYLTVCIMLIKLVFINSSSITAKDRLEKYLPDGAYIEHVHNKPLRFNGDSLFLAKVKNLSPEQYNALIDDLNLHKSFSKKDLLGMKFSMTVSWWIDPEGLMINTLCGKQGDDSRTWLYYNNGDCYYGYTSW